jgi:hypothetical protein
MSALDFVVQPTGLMSRETKDWSRRHSQFPVAARYSKFRVSTMGEGTITYADTLNFLTATCVFPVDYTLNKSSFLRTNYSVDVVVIGPE